MEEKKKSNKGLICLVVILLLTVLGLGGYILVDKDIIKLKKEEKKIEEKVKAKDEELDPGSVEVDFSKCLNHDDVEFREYTYYYDDGAFKTEISDDKKTVTLSIDWSSEFGKSAKMGGVVDENENQVIDYQIVGFQKKVKEVLVGNLGQSWAGVTVFYLMDDGTVYYSFIISGEDINNSKLNLNAAKSFDVLGPISDVTDVVKLQRATAGVNMGGSWITAIGVKEDGSFYDLSAIKNFIHH